MQASTADDLAGPWSDTEAVGSNWTTLGLPAGQYIKFEADFIRGDKQAPEIGPQSFGLIPLLTEFHVSPNPPCAWSPVGGICCLLRCCCVVICYLPGCIEADQLALRLTVCHLAALQVVPRNNYPTALCQPQYVFADNPTNQLDSTFGNNAEGRVCGAVLSAATAVDAGSHDPDTAELDSIVPIQPTSSFYSPSLYALVRLLSPCSLVAFNAERRRVPCHA